MDFFTFLAFTKIKEHKKFTSVDAELTSAVLTSTDEERLSLQSALVPADTRVVCSCAGAGKGKGYCSAVQHSADCRIQGMCRTGWNLGKPIDPLHSFCPGRSSP